MKTNTTSPRLRTSSRLELPHLGVICDMLIRQLRPDEIYFKMELIGLFLTAKYQRGKAIERPTHPRQVHKQNSYCDSVSFKDNSLNSLCRSYIRPAPLPAPSIAVKYFRTYHRECRLLCRRRH